MERRGMLKEASADSDRLPIHIDQDTDTGVVVM
jgi:hypothetical protein